MTTKKSTGRGSRHLSLRFYVYTSTLTQCTFDSPTSHSFHGSNSSNSKDNGSGGRTYNIPNYATRFVVPLQFHRAQGWTSASYANEKSNVISVTFDEDKGTPKAIIRILVIVLLFAAIPVFLMAPKSVERSTSTTELYDWSKQQINWETGVFKPQINVDSEDQARPRDQETKNLYWDKPQPGEHCLRFGTREYTARLWNLPLFTDWISICKNTKANIRGVSLEPSYCQSKWPFGGVEGHWVVDFNEEDCTPHWGEFVDKGCQAKGSKTRRFQSRLWNIKRQQDWRTMCESAPANFQSLRNATPKLCDDRGIWGIYGIWEVDDPNC